MTIRRKPLIPPGTVIGKYEIIRAVGSGGMGAVYEAKHTSLEKRVAVKTLHPAEAMKEDVVARLVREGRMASRIRHPHVVEVFDVDTHEGVPYLVMEFLEGEDLAVLLKRETLLPLEQACDIMVPVIAGVAAAHEQGVVHRDLKPENIFITRTHDGSLLPKVLDFGVSKVTSVLRVTALTRPGVILGTPIYMSPEQLMASKNADARSDQFSLGVMLYELTTGQRPFVAQMIFDLFNAIRDGKCTPPRQHVPSLPEAFEKVVLRTLRPTPADRFESMAEFGQALLPFASERTRAVWEPAFAKMIAAGPPPATQRDSSLLVLADKLKQQEDSKETKTPEAQAKSADKSGPVTVPSGANRAPSIAPPPNRDTPEGEAPSAVASAPESSARNVSDAPARPAPATSERPAASAAAERAATPAVSVRPASPTPKPVPAPATDVVPSATTKPSTMNAIYIAVAVVALVLVVVLGLSKM